MIAVIGLAYSFSVGRVQIDRFEVARAALAAAQDRMEWLSARGTELDFAVGGHPPSPLPFEYEGTSAGHQDWMVEWVDDPGTGVTEDLKRVTVRVWWTQGALTDTVRLSRLFLP